MVDFDQAAEPGFRVSAGQVMEFRIWAELIQQSRGTLHVFLPLLDRGLDAIVHRLTDGRYIPLQVKSRGELHGTKLQIVIPIDKLVDDNALIIAGLLLDDQLGQDLLVIDEGSFKQLASNLVFKGDEVFWIELNLAEPPDPWKQFIVPRGGLGERLLESPVAGKWALAPEAEGEQVDRFNSWLGFVGEAELIRQLSREPELDLFRPFPDIELVEVLARHRGSRGFCGIQVKTGTVTPAFSHSAQLAIRKATFVASPVSYVAALAWLPDEQTFSDECLLIPTEAIPRVAEDDDELWKLEFHPHSPKASAVDPYRLPRDELGRRVGELAG